MTRLGVGLLVALAVLAAGMAGSAATPIEVPALASRVARGEVPPLRDRLPERPLVLRTDPEAVYGGELRMLIGTPKDLELAFVYGYTRLVRFDAQYQVVPDIVERYSPDTFYWQNGKR